MFIIWMKLVCLFLTLLMIGFAVEESQASYVVVDSSLHRKYQAEPGRQEWITVIECICADQGCNQTEPKQPNRLLGRTEPSPSGQDGPPSKPNRACKPPNRARAEGLLGLLGLVS